MYGITETTVHTTYRPIREADLDSGIGSVFGVPIPDLTVHLLDENLKPVPPGTPGEICVGGAGVARGYLNRPELNAQRFIADPFANGAAKMYRSGDLAQVNAFGEMEYLGRMDHQVKIRGFRVELGEIESALNRHPAIRESVVMARGENEARRLVAYYVPRAEKPSTSELRSYLAPALPDYMLPAMFVPMKAFPLTNNGKVDRRALPDPETARPELSSGFVSPDSEHERTLAAIWQEVLSVSPIGTKDNFFELGGDSIRAIVVLSKARTHGLNFTLEDLFRTPTISGILCSHQSPAEANVEGTASPFSMLPEEDRAKLPPDVADAYPIAALQLGMFFHNELDPLSAMYHDVFSYRVGAPFDSAKLEKAAQLLIDRHPVLRTSFHLAGFSRPIQIVHSRVIVPFSAEDNRLMIEADREAAILSWIETEKRRPFDRSQAPLIRFHVQRQTDTAFQLFVSFHHSCTDGWSLAALVTEVLEDYTALLAGSVAAIPTPRIGYRDFVALESRTIASPESTRFWREHLAGSMPQQLPRWPRALRGHGHEQVRGPELQIAPQTLEGLKKLAQRAGAPLKTVLLAAHARVMSLLFGQRDIVTGLISNGRPEQMDGERLIGLFLNAVPFRQTLANGSWIDLVRQTFAAEQAVLPHRRFPLAEVQKLHGHSVLETAFDFVHFHVFNNLKTCGNLQFAEGPYFEANNLATYTTFMLDASSTKLELHIDYDPNEIAREQVERIDSYYLRTLEAMAATPELNWRDCTPMPEDEVRRMLVEWNETNETYPDHTPIHALFEEQAAKTPAAVAVEFNGQTVSYADLNRRADAVAAALGSAGAKPGSRIGLCVERSPDMLAGLLGILKSGSAYVPLDPAFPRERLAFIVKDAEADIILTDRTACSALPQTSGRLLFLEALTGQTAEVNFPQVSSRDLAYIIYTSGSTGQPKGVQIEHRSVVNLLCSAATKLRASPHDRLLAVTTLSFDIAGLELLMPLITGGTVVIASRQIAGDGPALAAMIEQTQPTLMQATPSTWRMLIEAGWSSSPQLRAICGGEALPPALARELLARCGEAWNFYGPTETTIWSTAWKVDASDPISIGRALANTEAYILDSEMAPVPVGSIGELMLGGHGLARGYWNRPQLTNEKFIPHPFKDGQQVYRTGDLARYLPDGRIECLGRIDHQVKIRGYRIELGEIETALGQHKTVRQAVVTAREDRFGDKRLTAYVVPSNGGIPLKELRTFLSEKLPAYMVPTHFVEVKALPLTPNGKIDLKQLPKPEEASQSSTPFIAPEGEIECALASIWTEVLSVPRVGADDNFFDLGADSLSATRAYARINASLKCGITLRQIFENPTVRLLGALAGGTVNRIEHTPIKRQPRMPAMAS
jgi:amino acid adenylation domain-containing protein